MQRKSVFLAGANTADGFVSKFDNILDKNKKGYTFVLKGGPGTGKSTLMKKIAKHFLDRGMRVEQFYCSSDTESLDAVRIVDKNICVTDGTAPHEQDASLPKVSGEIIDLGASIDGGIKKYRNKINKLILKKQKCFKNAYAYLKLAGDIARNFNKAKQMYFEIKEKRTLFFEYFESSGLRSLENKNKFKTETLSSKNKAQFENLLNTEKNIIEIKSVLTGGVKAVIFSDLNLMYKTEKIVLDEENKNLVKTFCLLAGKNIEKAKKYHKQVEKFYLNYINFEKLNEITNTLIKKIENA